MRDSAWDVSRLQEVRGDLRRAQLGARLRRYRFGGHPVQAPLRATRHLRMDGALSEGMAEGVDIGLQLTYQSGSGRLVERSLHSLLGKSRHTLDLSESKCLAQDAPRLQDHLRVLAESRQSLTDDGSDCAWDANLGGRPALPLPVPLEKIT